MSDQLPVNPDVLKWARESSGYSIGDVVIKFNIKSINASVVSGWEVGEGSPSYPQLEKLAYKFYKRPLAIFFMPAPPDDGVGKASFRTMSHTEFDSTPPRIRILMRKAKSFQLSLNELFSGVNPSEDPLVRQASLSTDSNLAEITSKVRGILGISMKQQVEFSSTEDAFKAWRGAFNQAGIFIFKDAFQEKGYSGFCLYDQNFPLIYINNSHEISRQIFSLFHELAHILLHTDGVDLNESHNSSSKIEKLCDAFAGEFLVPDSEFWNVFDGGCSDSDYIAWGKHFNVSKEVILTKAFHNNIIEWPEYSSTLNRWRSRGKKSSNSGGSYYNNQGVYLDRKFMEKAFSKYYQNHLSIDQLASFLNVKVKSIAGIESGVLKHGGFPVA